MNATVETVNRRSGRFRWGRFLALLCARLKYLAWQLLAKGVLGVIYIAVISEGLRVLVPALGQKLSKLAIPGAWMLAEDEAGHRLDLAHIFALFLLIAVFHLWAEVIRSWLRPDDPEDEGFDPDNYFRLVATLAVVILGADAFLFFYSVTQMGWTGGEISFTAILVTAAYVAVLIFVSFVSVNLRQQVIDLSKED